MPYEQHNECDNQKKQIRRSISQQPFATIEKNWYERALLARNNKNNNHTRYLNFAENWELGSRNKQASSWKMLTTDVSWTFSCKRWKNQSIPRPRISISSTYMARQN